MPLVFGGAGKPLLKTLAKSEERRIKAEFWVAFSLNTFFGHAKESISAVGPRPDSKITVAAATQYDRWRGHSAFPLGA